MNNMNSYSKILGTIFAFGVIVMTFAPNLNTMVKAVDIDLSDFECIAPVGNIGNNICSEDNSSNKETTTDNVDNSTTNIDKNIINNIDNRTSNIVNTVSDSCNGQATGSITQEGGNESATLSQTQQLCTGLGAISLPN